MSRKIYHCLLLFYACYVSISSFAQGVSINTTGNTPDPSSMLDIQAINKGLLIPRVALTDINDATTVPAPALYLIVFNTNPDIGRGDGIGIYYNNVPIGALWIKLSTENDIVPGWLLNGSNITNSAFIGSTNNQDVVFKRNNVEAYRILENGTLLATGNASGAVPAAAAGTKLFWAPAKAAFRAGRITGLNGLQWNNANVGDASFAAGQNSIARGNRSVAIGDSSVAAGSTSIALGNHVTATTTSSFAAGEFSNATGIGAIALGSSNTASGDNAIALGISSVASGPNAVAIGSTANATNIGSIALGINLTSSNFASIALGYFTSSSGVSSLACGTLSTASGNNSIAIGNTNSATGAASVALGETTTANGNAATAIGEGTIANVRGGLAIGRYNEEIVITPTNTATLTVPVFQIGNGTSAIRKDIFAVHRNGKVYANGIELTSDIRLKRNISNLNNVLVKINHIQPIIYNFIETDFYPRERQIGFSAQEIEQQFPELVSKNQKGYLSLNYSNMTAIAIQAIKEQQEIIDGQKNKLHEYEDKLAQLSEKLEKGQIENELIKNRLMLIEKLLKYP